MRARAWAMLTACIFFAEVAKSNDVADEFWSLVTDRCIPAVFDETVPDTSSLIDAGEVNGVTLRQTQSGGAALSWKRIRDGLLGCNVNLNTLTTSPRVLDEMQRDWIDLATPLLESGRFITINDCQVDGFDHYRGIGSTTTTKSGKFIAMIFFISSPHAVFTVVSTDERPKQVCKKDSVEE